MILASLTADLFVAGSLTAFLLGSLVYLLSAPVRR